MRCADHGGMTSHAGYVSARGGSDVRTGSISFRGSGTIGHTVVDRTGLRGVFTFTLEWTPDDKQGANPDGPSIMTALQEQLGLKLEASKAAADVIIITPEGPPRINLSTPFQKSRQRILWLGAHSCPRAEGALRALFGSQEAWPQQQQTRGRIFEMVY